MSLRFGDPVRYQERGAWHNALVISQGEKDERRIDLMFLRQVVTGAGDPVNVAGTSRQAEAVQFRHDVMPGEYEPITLPADQFFAQFCALADGEVAQIVADRERANNDRIALSRLRQADEEKQEQLKHVKIRPSTAVMEKAKDLWTDALVQGGHVGAHDEIELPDYRVNPEAWQPWIERAKAALRFSDPVQQTQEPPPSVN